VAPQRNYEKTKNRIWRSRHFRSLRTGGRCRSALSGGGFSQLTRDWRTVLSSEFFLATVYRFRSSSDETPPLFFLLSWGSLDSLSSSTSSHHGEKRPVVFLSSSISPIISIKGSLASKPYSRSGRLEPQQRLSRSRSTRPVEERHVLRSSRTLFLWSVHPNKNKNKPQPSLEQCSLVIKQPKPTPGRKTKASQTFTPRARS
jgi:hypothetical protein